KPVRVARLAATTSKLTASVPVPVMGPPVRPSAVLTCVTVPLPPTVAQTHSPPGKRPTWPSLHEGAPRVSVAPSAAQATGPAGAWGCVGAAACGPWGRRGAGGGAVGPPGGGGKGGGGRGLRALRKAGGRARGAGGPPACEPVARRHARDAVAAVPVAVVTARR